MPMSVKIVPKQQPRPRPPRNRLVVALATMACAPSSSGWRSEIFGLDRPEMGKAWYRFRVAAIEPGSLRAAGGIRVESDGGLRLVERAGTIIVPGWRGADAPVPARLLAALRRAHTRGARLVSFCSGVFVLAATGLDGRRATTHWRHADRLAGAYPKISVVPDVLYIDEGNLLTAAGSAAGIDLSLHLIRRDWVRRQPTAWRGDWCGAAASRRRPGPVHRGAGARGTGRGRLGPLLERLRAGLGGETSIAALAKTAGMSRRTFLRRFKANTGTTPGAWLAAARVARARDLLKTSQAAIEEVAAAAGLHAAPPPCATTSASR